jgi:hypothetical protein
MLASVDTHGTASACWAGGDRQLAHGYMLASCTLSDGVTSAHWVWAAGMLVAANETVPLWPVCGARVVCPAVKQRSVRSGYVVGTWTIGAARAKVNTCICIPYRALTEYTNTYCGPRVGSRGVWRHAQCQSERYVSVC